MATKILSCVFCVLRQGIIEERLRKDLEVVLGVGDIVLGREVRQEEPRGRGALWDQFVEFVDFFTVSAVTVSHTHVRGKIKSVLGHSYIYQYSILFL